MSMMHSSESRRAPEIMERIRLASGSRFSLYVLVCLHIVICCTSLAQVAHWQSYMLYDAARLYYAIAAVLAFSTVSLLFIFARFSFGYFIGFNLFTMLLGFIWLNNFSKFNYDHRLAGLSAAASAVLFLLPALLISGRDYAEFFDKAGLEFLSHPNWSSQLITSVVKPKGNGAQIQKFLQENRLPEGARPTAEEIEAQIMDARESWE